MRLMIPISLLSDAAPLLRKGSRMFPLGLHSFRAAALRLSSDRFVMVLFASVNITERSNGLHEEMGIGVADGDPLEVHTGGSEGTVTLVARNSQMPLRFAPVWKKDLGTVKPLPVAPGAKRLAGVASPEGESIRFSKV